MGVIALTQDKNNVGDVPTFCIFDTMKYFLIYGIPFDVTTYLLMYF